jgi:hypothetical protein
MMGGGLALAVPLPPKGSFNLTLPRMNDGGFLAQRSHLN